MGIYQRGKRPNINLYFEKKEKDYRGGSCFMYWRNKFICKILDDIIEELRGTKTSERVGKAQNQEDSYATRENNREG